MAKDETSIRNAGIVLLNQYIPMLFERMEIMQDKVFKDETGQNNAVHYLQYLVSGFSDTEVLLMSLNNVLCGIPVAQSVKEEVIITQQQRELMDGLINAAISHWPSIGSCSVSGFRGNWLVRDGSLIEKDDRWELLVEKRTYDLLINQSPFSFSIIKYPWMNKPLYVTWRF